MPSSNSATELRNLRVADTASPYQGAVVDVRIGADGTLIEITPADGGGGGLDCMGQFLVPAWADAWVQSPEPGHEARATLEAVAAEAYAGGVADVLLLPNTAPVVDNAGAVRSLVARAAGLPSRLHPVGALTLGAKGEDLAELLDMQQAGALAFSDGTRPVQSTAVLLRALQYARLTTATILQQPQEGSLSQGQHAAESPHGTRLGFKGIPVLAETLALQRDLTLVATTGQPMHFSPITSAAGAELIRQAKASGLPVSASTSVVHLVLTDEAIVDFDTRLKVLPPLRTAMDRSALLAAVADGTLDLVTSHHTPLTVEEKVLEWSYAAAGATCLGVLASAAFTALAGVLPDPLARLMVLTDRLAHAPRRLMGLPPETVAVGASRLVRFDPAGVSAEPGHPPTYDAWQDHTWPFGATTLVGRSYPLW